MARPTADRGSASWQSISQQTVLAGLLTAVLAMAVLVYRAETVRSAPYTTPTYAPAFRGELTGPGAMLNAHDGQAFGSLALDPLLAHPERWSSQQEMAYRAARPLLGWLVALTSFGSRRVAEWSLLGWTAVGAGLLAAAAFVLAARWGRKGDWVPLLLALPAMVGQLLFGGLSDALATGLALLGLAWWLERRDGWAVAAFCTAALCRETSLVVPLALLLAPTRREVSRLLLPFASYVAWAGIVWLRLHSLPTDAGHGRLGLPFVGLVSVIGSWTWVEIVSAASVVVLGAVAFWRAPGPEVRWLVIVSAVFASLLGPDLWRVWDLARPLLPVTVVGACLLAGRAAPVGETGAVAAVPAVPIAEAHARRA